MLDFAIPCLLGLEKLVGDEVKKLGLTDVRVENGRVLCRGGEADIARLNINLRCGARVLVVLNTFRATDFEALFQGVKAVAWEDWIGREDEFPVTGYSINSTLHSVPACQSIVKKAAAERLGAAAEDAPVLDAHVGKPQLFHFVAHELFKPQQAGNGKIKHSLLHFSFFSV